MTLTYQRAALSLCLSLTDPHAMSVPVGSLVVGDVDAGRFACLATGPRDARLANLDELTEDLLRHLPGVLHRKVLTAVERAGLSASLADVMLTLNLSLRGSIYVSEVRETERLELADVTAELVPGVVVSELVRLAFGYYNELVPVNFAQIAAGRAWPARQAAEAPELGQFIWPLPRARMLEVSA